MKITDVRARLLMKRFIIVEVHTDEGIIGYGECSPMNGPVTKVMVESALKPHLLGEDPFQIERLWEKMFIRTIKLGPMGVQMNAIAGVDIALWDILGKALNQPIYNLIGGLYRDKVEVYASSGGGRHLTPKQIAERAASYVERGYKAVKQRMDWREDNTDPHPDHGPDAVREMRAAVGDQIDISFDPNNGYTPHRAIQVGRILEQYRVYHFEEPVASYDYPGIAKVAQALDIPVAAGEQEYTRWQFRDLITIGQVDIIQPDIIKCGGISEIRKIAVVGQTYNKQIKMHQTQPTIGTLAALHFALATPNCVYRQEHPADEHPLKEAGLLVEPVPFRDGALYPPAGPGLGIEVDRKVLQRLEEE